MRHALALFIGISIGRAWGPPAVVTVTESISPDELVYQRAKEAVRNVMVQEAQALASRNGIRWSPDEFPVMASYAEIHDLPPQAAILVRKWENGGMVFKTGQHRIIQGIRATTWPDEQQYHQVVRMLDRARWWLICDRPDMLREFVNKHGPRAEPEAFIRMYPTAYFNHFVEEAQKPARNREAMKKFLVENFKKEDLKGRSK